MANKKKNVKKEEEKKNKKVTSKKEEKKVENKTEKKAEKKAEKKVTVKEDKKEKEFEKLVEEEELEMELADEVEVEDEEDDDEDAFEEIITDKKVVVDPDHEMKVLKLLTCISICVSVVTLLISLIILDKVTPDDTTSAPQEETNTEESNTSYDTSMFDEISANDFIDMFDEDDDEIRFVYTGTSGCGYCVAFLPSLQQSVEEYDYTLYYLPTDTLTKDDINEIREFDEELEENFPATPMVYAIKNGEVIDYNDGYTEYSTYTEFLEDNEVEEK